MTINTAILPDHKERSAAPAAAPQPRVLLFTNSVAIGGMEKHIEMLARDLDSSKVELFTICPEWGPIAPWVAELEAIADASARITPDRRYGYAAFFKESFKLWRQIRRWRIQVMHLHLASYRGGLYAALIARLAGVKVLVCTEHLAPQEPLARSTRIHRFLFSRTVDRLICVSYKNRRLREQFLYTPRTKTTVINNGVDLAECAPVPAEDVQRVRDEQGIPVDAPVVGTAVRFVEEKGLTYLLDAMPQVLANVPSAYLLLVGDGPQRAQLEQQIDALGIRDRVILAGFQADPRPYLSLMNAFVLPWPWGSASIGLLEAMAMRRAVVVTFGGEGEPVLDGETGLWAKPRDPASLASAILNILQSPVYERALGEQARRHIEREFSSQRVATQVLDLYTQELDRAQHQ